MTVKSKKRRLKRARAHQAQSKGKNQFHRAWDHAGMQEKEDAALAGKSILDLQREYNERAAQEPPKRAKCPSCGFSQKVRKDGTMSRHDVFIGSDPQQCEGTGKQWNAS